MLLQQRNWQQTKQDLKVLIDTLSIRLLPWWLSLFVASRPTSQHPRFPASIQRQYACAFQEDGSGNVPTQQLSWQSQGVGLICQWYRWCWTSWWTIKSSKWENFGHFVASLTVFQASTKGMALVYLGNMEDLLDWSLSERIWFGLKLEHQFVREYLRSLLIRTLLYVLFFCGVWCSEAYIQVMCKIIPFAYRCDSSCIPNSMLSGFRIFYLLGTIDLLEAVTQYRIVHICEKSKTKL